MMSIQFNVPAAYEKYNIDKGYRYNEIISLEFKVNDGNLTVSILQDYVLTEFTLEMRDIIRLGKLLESLGDD